MAGFFKVPHDVYRALSRDPNAFRVYCELASRARWNAGTCLGSHGVVELAAGQCIVGRAEVAAALDMTERAIRTAIKRLSALRVLTIEATKLGTLVTLHDDSASAEQWPTERPSVDTKNDQASDPKPTNRTPTNEEIREEVKKEDRRERSKRKASPLPDQWVPRAEDNMLSGKQLEHELAAFRDHAEANGRTQKDWNAAWRLWQRRAASYVSNGRRPPIAVGSAAPANSFGTGMRVPRRQSGLEREEQDARLSL